MSASETEDAHTPEEIYDSDSSWTAAVKKAKDQVFPSPRIRGEETGPGLLGPPLAIGVRNISHLMR